MALEKQTAIDQIVVQENGVVEVREVTRIMETNGNDSVEIGRTYHRTSYAPGADVSAVDPKVQAICAAAWTPELIEKYKQASAN